MSAYQRHDWRASWELLCHSRQLELGPVDRYIRLQEAAAAMVEPFTAGATTTVGEARPNGRSSPQSHVVDLIRFRAGESHRAELVVVEEQGDFRACGQW